MINIKSFDSFNEKKKWIKDAIKNPGALKKSLGKEDEKLTKKEINAELNKLKAKDKDKDKKGTQLDKADATKKRRLELAKTLGSLKESKEDRETSRYMFFSNLEQIRRQAGLLLDMDEESIQEILENGHDWAQDHIATSKESIDQVFDFLMNQSKGGDMWKSVDLEDREDIMNDESEEDMKSEEGQNIKGFEDFQ